MRITIIILKIVVLITTTQLLLSSGCNKDGTRPCFRAPYSFAVTCNYSPEKEIYNIGDTIFIESIFQKTLISLLNISTVVDYSNSTGIGGGIGFGYMDTMNRKAIPARDSFELLPIVGTFSELPNIQNQSININFIETAQDYRFKAAIICKKKGIYGLGVADLYSNGIRGKNCTNAGFVITVTNPNKHLYLHQYALGVDPNDPMLQRTGYDFRVQ